MKKFLVLIMTLFICVLFSMSSSAATTSNATKINAANQLQQTDIGVNEIKKINDEIVLLNYIGIKIQEIVETKSAVTLTDTINMIQKGGLRIVKISNPDTREYLLNLFDSALDWKLNEMDRDRAQLLYDQKDAKAMNEALKPSVAGLIATTAVSAFTKDPFSSALSIGTLVADRVNAYNRSLEESESEFAEKEFQFKKNGIKIIEGIKKDFFEYTAKRVDALKNEISNINSLYVTQKLAGDYSNLLKNENITLRKSEFERIKSQFEGYPSINLELASCYYELGEYKKCVLAVDKYLETRGDIFNYDPELTSVYPLAFSAASKYMSAREYEEYATKHLKFIDSTFESDLDRGDINKRLPLFRYKIALVYLDLFNKTGKMEYIDKAYEKSKANLGALVKKQEELSKEDELAVYDLLISNLEVLKATAKKKNISKDEKELLDNILYGNSDLFPTVLLRECYSFGDRNTEYNNIIDEAVKREMEATNENTNYSPYAYMYARTIKGEYSYYYVYLYYGGIKDSEVIINFKDKNGTTYTKTLPFKSYYNAEGGYFEYSLYDFDDIIDFDEETIFDIELIPKRNIECRTRKYRLKCIKMPLGRDEIKEKKTLDEIANLLIDLGFNGDNIASSDSNKWFEKNDGLIYNILFSNFYNPWDGKEIKWRTEQWHSWSKDELLSTNQNFFISYR